MSADTTPVILITGGNEHRVAIVQAVENLFNDYWETELDPHFVKIYFAECAPLPTMELAEARLKEVIEYFTSQHLTIEYDTLVVDLSNKVTLKETLRGYAYE